MIPKNNRYDLLEIEHLIEGVNIIYISSIEEAMTYLLDTIFVKKEVESKNISETIMDAIDKDIIGDIITPVTSQIS